MLEINIMAIRGRRGRTERKRRSENLIRFAMPLELSQFVAFLKKRIYPEFNSMLNIAFGVQRGENLAFVQRIGREPVKETLILLIPISILMSGSLFDS